MRLIIVRHAKAKNREKWVGKDDLKRPLTKKGKKQAKIIAELIAKKYKVDAVISSLALRACDTAKYIAKKQPHCTFKLASFINPEEGIEGFLHNKDKIEEDWQTLVVVGHEPSIGELVRFLCAKGTLNIKIGKGCVIELEHIGQDEWKLVGLHNF
ncbi:MAG: histidine phosphatase family protein [Helicobacter sp.]|nr:histidine phosphatase family protein [Helicobacteraceae bacterium]MDY3112901.1 histidine phosphatase family protein [Helicobacter sp.]